jgi:hypothetical protein
MAIAAVGMLALPGRPANAAPERPTDDDLVLAVVAPDQSRADADLRAAKDDLARNPKDIRLAVNVARLAIEEGRASSDPRRYGQAEAALAPWWTESDPPEEVHVLRAVIRQALHDFSGALADLDATLDQSPQNGQARLSRAFVRMVVGDLAGAAEDCRALPPTVGLLPAAACRARVDTLTGAALPAYARLARAIALDGGAGETTRRFAVLVLADIAAGLGRDGEVDRLLAEAAQLGRPDVPLLVAMADHYLDTGRAFDGLVLLDGMGDADVLMLRRAIAAKRVGDPRLPEWAAVLNERFAAARAAGNSLHLREEARFRLEVEERAETAVALAAENWRSQKEPADARLLLQAAVAAGNPDAATDVVRFVSDVGLVDARITPLLRRIEELGR